MEEQWKEIPEFNGAYQISSYGRLKSVERTVKHPQGSCVLKEKILSEVVNKRGYIEYQITHNGNHYSRKAHRLVAEAFIPNVNNLPQVNHIDAVKTNNHVENLEWCDNQHNILHAYEAHTERVLEADELYRCRFSKGTGSQLEYTTISSSRKFDLRECAYGNF